MYMTASIRYRKVTMVNTSGQTVATWLPAIKWDNPTDWTPHASEPLTEQWQELTIRPNGVTTPAVGTWTHPYNFFTPIAFTDGCRNPNQNTPGNAGSVGTVITYGGLKGGEIINGQVVLYKSSINSRQDQSGRQVQIKYYFNDLDIAYPPTADLPLYQDGDIWNATTTYKVSVCFFANISLQDTGARYYYQS
jgi:hypothetical protein